jgi:hypothetical protein
MTGRRVDPALGEYKASVRAEQRKMRKSQRLYRADLLPAAERLRLSASLVDALSAWLTARGRWLGNPVPTETPRYVHATLMLEAAALAFFGRAGEAPFALPLIPTLEQELQASLKNVKAKKKKR